MKKIILMLLSIVCMAAFMALPASAQGRHGQRQKQPRCGHHRQSAGKRP